MRRKDKLIGFARYRDALTNLPNRTLLRDLLSAALSQTTDHAVAIAVLYLDIDNFKRINDNLGYQAGDRLIQETTARLASCLRPEEVIATASRWKTPCGMPSKWEKSSPGTNRASACATAA